MISIKGLRDGLLVVFDEQPWLTQLRELEARFVANSHFFKGGRMALDVKTHVLTQDEIKRLTFLLTQFDVTLWAILTQSDETAHNIHTLGHSTNLSDKPQQNAISPAAEGDEPANGGHIDATDGLLVRKRVRSGQVLRHPGHIVVIGDVNPGAQLIAGGDIIVWGKLHGMAHAGALGDLSSVICALELLPGVLRIADATRSALYGQKRRPIKHPEMALLDDQEITVISWNEK